MKDPELVCVPLSKARKVGVIISNKFVIVVTELARCSGVSGESPSPNHCATNWCEEPRR